jgi:hypothetical protein
MEIECNGKILSNEMDSNYVHIRIDAFVIAGMVALFFVIHLPMLFM